MGEHNLRQQIKMAERGLTEKANKLHLKRQMSRSPLDRIAKHTMKSWHQSLKKLQDTEQSKSQPKKAKYMTSKSNQNWGEANKRKTASIIDSDNRGRKLSIQHIGDEMNINLEEISTGESMP